MCEPTRDALAARMALTWNQQAAAMRACRALTGSVDVHRVLTFGPALDHPRRSTV
ncbi:hypothetical protein [Streptomyces sp. NPDC026589]|uniref:hypothetical protein n=1 Tax=Streptomyces sp. NPDC026589 TaxID=3155609 RepID=UPI0033DDB6E8